MDRKKGECMTLQLTGHSFTYANRRFIGTTRKMGSFHDASRHTRWVFDAYKDPAFNNMESGSWSYRGFYDKAGRENTNTDLFFCLDDQKLYIPGEHTLFLWTEKIR